jgi:predicted nucleic acid-binding protein
VRKGSTVVLDDAEARRCARTLGIPLLGTLGIVLRAKKRGRVESARTVLRDLLGVGFYLDDDLIAEVLQRAAGEEWKP